MNYVGRRRYHSVGSSWPAPLVVCPQHKQWASDFADGDSWLWWLLFFGGQYLFFTMLSLSSWRWMIWRVGGWDAAQLVERQTGTLLRQVQFSDVARDFSPTVSFSADSLMVFVQPPCVITCINICVHIKGLKRWQPYLCFDTWKYCMHCWEWVALLFWVLWSYAAKANRTSHKGEMKC